MSAATTVRITVDLPESLHKRLKLQAANSGQRVADLVRGWVETHCPDHDAWFVEQVKLGIADDDAGRVVTGAALKKLDHVRRAALLRRADIPNQAR